MHRLFVALRPPPAIRDQLADVMEGVPDARWQDDEQLHCTLRFVGDVDGRTADDLADALAQLRAPAPVVTLAGVGSFAKRGRTDTLWADVAPRAPLADLHRKIDHACVRVGLEPERRAFRPHVTLARMARSAGAHPSVAAWLARHTGLASAPFAMPHLILYESQLGSGGATYTPVVRWALADGRDGPTITQAEEEEE